MEVTRKNFKDTLPLISASIDKADFLVIDAEFTGLINGRDVSIFDSPQEYYLRLLNGSGEFLLIQYGLCAFYWNEEKKHYMNDSYNFYVFPRGRPGPERMFLCQSSSLDFLASQGFDFNKLIKDGISYMTEPMESRLRELLTERQKLYSNEKDIITIPEENKQQIEEICNKVHDFIKDKQSKEMEIDRCNAFIRRLLFQELGTRFKNEIFVETKVLENKNRILKVSKVTSETDTKDRDLQKKEKEWEEFEEAVGFSKVARMISQSEKLVIGHNMLLDLLHTLNHFFQPLPADYEMFKEFAHCMFPKLLDTKYMSSLPPFKDKVNSSVLQHLLLTLSEAPFVMPVVDSEEGRGYSDTDDKHHEAGYDAYITGLCFLAMHSHLTKMRGEDSCRVTSPDSATLKPFVNKVFLAKTAHQDSPYINLVGSDPTPSRDHVFHLSFPKEWQRNDINQLFSPFGPITLQFLDDTSALIALSRREQAKDVMRILSSNGKTILLPYIKYKRRIDKMQSQLSSYCMNTPDFVTRSVRVSSSFPTTSQSPKAPSSPVKTDRQRSNSVSVQSSSPQKEREQTSRKRTSSGVFQVDDAEPPPKKAELLASEEPRKRSVSVSNGRRQTSETEKDEHIYQHKVDKGERIQREKFNAKSKEIKNKVDKMDKEKKKVMDKFDIDARTTTVSAFKESDSWD